MHKKDFPKLDASNHTPESPADPYYNCIAWAAGENHRHWWPLAPLNAYWPHSVPNAETLDAFVAAFGTLGYEPCADGAHEAGFEKVALFADANGPTHAARQVTQTRWASKMGRGGIDIHHDLEAVEGPLYGRVVRFLRRPSKEPPKIPDPNDS